MALRVPDENACMILQHVVSLRKVGRLYLRLIILRIMIGCVDYTMRGLLGTSIFERVVLGWNDYYTTE